MTFLKFLSTLLFSLVLSRLHYYNFLYYNLPKSSLQPLTKTFNSAACLVSYTPLFSHISPFFINLHWLPIHFSFFFKITFFHLEIFFSNSPSYLSNLSLPPKRADLRSSTCTQLFPIFSSHFYPKTAFSSYPLSFSEFLHLLIFS